MENQETSVFDDAQRHQQPAATGLRFVNYLIDMVLFYGVFFACMFLLGVITIAMGGDANALALYLDSGVGKIFMYLGAFAVLTIMYTLIEGVSGGRSLGKLITGTVAVREDGSRISWKDALMRSLCRCIPFEALSGLSGYPWHDKITKTLVVKKQS